MRLRGGRSEGARGAQRAGPVRRRRAGERVRRQGKYSRDRDGADGAPGRSGPAPSTFPARATSASPPPRTAGPGLRGWTAAPARGSESGAAGRDAGGSGEPGLASRRAPLPHSRRDPGARVQSHEPQQHEQRGREGAHSHALG